jgi:hypothetical protein
VEGKALVDAAGLRIVSGTGEQGVCVPQIGLTRMCISFLAVCGTTQGVVRPHVNSSLPPYRRRPFAASRRVGSNGRNHEMATMATDMQEQKKRCAPKAADSTRCRHRFLRDRERETPVSE